MASVFQFYKESAKYAIISLMKEEELLNKRFLELANKAYQNNIYTFTAFLNPMEYASLLALAKEFPPIAYRAFGGTEDAERVVVRFGSPEDFGYEEDFPIIPIEIRPANMKYADELTHRDILGALMHLGIERSLLGDIVVHENVGYVFCLEKMADFITEELCKVKHTVVTVKRVDQIPEDWTAKKQEVKLLAESERIDGVIAKIFKLSRSETIDLFREKKIFVNAALEENNSRTLKKEDVVSVRGYGKFIYCGLQSTSKKGKLNLLAELYIK